VREEEWYSEQSPLTQRAFDLVEFAWIGNMEPDGQVMYNCEEVPSEGNFWSGQNYGGWCNETATAALLRAATEIQHDARLQDYRIAQQQFTQDIPALPLFSRLDLYAASPTLSNLKLDPTETMTWNVWEWSMPAKKP
jgi:ABC-type transport system substrate-binding protein